MLKRLKENALLWLGVLFFVLVTGVLGPTLDAHASIPGRAMVKAPEQPGPKFMYSGKSIIFQDEKGEKYLVGERWKAIQMVAVAHKGQDTVWVMVGETGERDCAQEWVVLRTGPNHPGGEKWTLDECYLDDPSDPEVVIYPKSAIVRLGNRSYVVK